MRLRRGGSLSAETRRGGTGASDHDQQTGQDRTVDCALFATDGQLAGHLRSAAGGRGRRRLQVVPGAPRRCPERDLELPVACRRSLGDAGIVDGRGSLPVGATLSPDENVRPVPYGSVLVADPSFSARSAEHTYELTS